MYMMKVVCMPEVANISLKNDCFGGVVLCFFAFLLCCCCLAFLSISWSDCSCMYTMQFV